MASQINSVARAQDLRAPAQDWKRTAAQKYKWEHGECRGPGVRAEAPARPVRSCFRPKIHKGLSAKGLQHNDIATAQLEAATDSSCDEEVEEPSVAPEPDAGVAYSYDAARGPSHGSQILGSALELAVAQFENTVTERLVQNEYEMLDSNGGSILTTAERKTWKPAIATKDDDEYEFV